MSLQGRHNGRDGVSNHQSYDCLLNRLFRRWSKKTSKLIKKQSHLGTVNKRGNCLSAQRTPNPQPLTKICFAFCSNCEVYVSK